MMEGEVISVVLSKKIQIYQGESAEELGRCFAEARLEYEKYDAERERYDKGEKELKINGEKIAPEKLSKILGKCHTMPSSALGFKVVNEYSPKAHDVVSIVPVNARKAIRTLEKILKEIPGAKTTLCPSEVEAWLKERENNREK